MKTISIIIITLNEAEQIPALLERLMANRTDRVLEVIVVDGGSSDGTDTIAKAAGAKVLISPVCGRAAQMNYGAQHATGGILYFVHGDCLPPSTYAEDIIAAVEANYPIGCYRFLFDSESILLKVNSFFTRFDKMWCRGGDQTLFVKRQLYDELGGYDERFLIMEEYDFIGRARQKYPFRIIPKNVIVSARKYDNNGYLKVQLANLLIFNMYRLGCSQQQMRNWYQRLLGVR